MRDNPKETPPEHPPPIPYVLPDKPRPTRPNLAAWLSSFPALNITAAAAPASPATLGSTPPDSPGPSLTLPKCRRRPAARRNAPPGPRPEWNTAPAFPRPFTAR